MKLLRTLLLVVLTTVLVLLSMPSTQVAAEAELPDVVGLQGYEAKAIIENYLQQSDSIALRRPGVNGGLGEEVILDTNLEVKLQRLIPPTTAAARVFSGSEVRTIKLFVDEQMTVVVPPVV